MACSGANDTASRAIVSCRPSQCADVVLLGCPVRNRLGIIVFWGRDRRDADKYYGNKLEIEVRRLV
jgi:hypothetical protein